MFIHSWYLRRATRATWKRILAATWRGSHQITAAWYTGPLCSCVLAGNLVWAKLSCENCQAEAVGNNAILASHTQNNPPRYCCLVLHGSFNPVHNGHIEMLKIARERLFEHGWVVVRAYLAPTSGSHILQKSLQCIADEHRLAMLEKATAIEEMRDWVFVYPKGVDFTNGHVLVRTQLVPLAKMQEPQVDVGFSLIGADVALNRRAYIQEQSPDGCHPQAAVVIGRGGSEDEDVKAALADAGNLENRVFFFDARSCVDVSSTAVRNALANGDLRTLWTMCPKTVADYLQEHQKTLYASSNAKIEQPASKMRRLRR